MDWLNWGKQSSIFGLPIGLAILIISFVNMYAIADTWSLLTLNSELNFYMMGHILAHGFTFIRKMLLFQILTRVLWGLVALLNIAIFRRNQWLAYVTLAFAAVFYTETVVVLGAGLYEFLMGRFCEESQSYRRFLYLHSRHSVLGWPEQFWVFFVLRVGLTILFAVVVFDAHYSYLKIIQHNGTGWEGKAYYEIHQLEGNSVVALQQAWDSHMGLNSEAIEKARKGQPSETSPLVSNNV